MRVPGPTSDGIVDYGRPDEDEDHDGTQAAALSDSADGKDGTDRI